jgi:predicted transposase
VKLTVQIKLLPTPEQAMALRETLETVNRAANRLSQLAWDSKEFRRFPLHKTFYRQIRDEFPLSAQIVCLLNAKVVDAYKLDKMTTNSMDRGIVTTFDAWDGVPIISTYNMLRATESNVTLP